MVNHRKFVFLVFMSLLLIDCSQQRIITTQTTPTVFTGKEIEIILPTRESEARNSLSLSVEITNIKISEQSNNMEYPHVITLNIIFANTSDHAIVFKKPRSTGFTGQGLLGYPVMFNDVGIVIQRKDGMPMGVSPSSHFMARPPANGGLEIFFYHLPEDFVTLESGETFSYTFTEDLPIVQFGDDLSATKLPPGTYALFLGYGNDFVGYQLPINATPPVHLHYFPDPSVQIVDMNAWVGKITSNIVEFTIPN